MKQWYLTECKQDVNVLFCPFVYVPFTLIFFYKLLLYSLYQYNVFMNILHTLKRRLLHKAKGQNRTFTNCPFLLYYLMKMTLEKEKEFYLEMLDHNIWNYWIDEKINYQLFRYSKRVIQSTNLYDFVQALKKYTIEQLKMYNLL